MTNNASLFTTLEPDSTTIITANGKPIRATGIGTVTITPLDSGSSELTLFNVLLVPALGFNLISVHELNKDHLRVEFSEYSEVSISDPFERSFLVSASWSWESQAYVLHVRKGVTQTTGAALLTTTSSWPSDELDDEELAPLAPSDRDLRTRSLWHERIGHLGDSSFPTLVKHSVGLPDLLKRRCGHGVFRCETCSLTNIRRRAFPDSTTVTSRPLELVHADLTGRIIAKSLGGAEYLAVIVDDFTRMVWVLPLARKSDFVTEFIKWRDEVVPLMGPIACLRTDGGGEFDNAAVRAALSGARHEMSCAYTSQQNGVAERHVGIIKSIMRPLLHARQLPIRYWAEAAVTAAYLRIRSPSRRLGGLTPYEMWHGVPPVLTDLRVFGCLAFAMLTDPKREHDLAVRSRVGVFIGYDRQRKGYRIHFPDTDEVVVTRNVEFHEKKGFDFTTVPNPQTTASSAAGNRTAAGSSVRTPGVRPRLVVIGPKPPPAQPEAAISYVDEVPGSVGVSKPRPPPQQPPAPSAAPPHHPPPAPAAPPPLAPNPQPQRAPSAAPAPAPPPQAAAPRPPRQPPAARQPPTREYNTRAHVRRMEEGRARLRESAGAAVMSLRDTFANAFKAMLSADGIELEPSTLRQAMRRSDWPRWLEAMRTEMRSHEEMGTWVVCELPVGREVVGCRWVFKLKLDADGNVLKYKARLVAQGFSQTPGVDYDDTYAPVARFVTVRSLLALAIFLCWHVHQLDVITAYLHGLLGHEIYLRQPPQFEVPGMEHLVCLLRRALYGLKQSGREWYFTLRKALEELGFVVSFADPAVFIFGRGASAIVVVVYVDDVLVLGADLQAILDFKHKFASRFRMTDQGEIGQFLGMKIERSADQKSFLISQSFYIRSILERFDLVDLKPISSPLDTRQRLLPYDDEADEEVRKRYQAMLGCVNWLAQASRPDLSYAVTALSRHANNPGPIHVGCMKRTFRYLVDTIDLKFTITCSASSTISAHSDADFGGDFSAKSTSGWCVAVHGATVAWGSKLQTLVADSTAQAELIAVWQTSREVLAIRFLLEDLGFDIAGTDGPSVIYCDNQPALHILTNPVSNGLSRHIERKYLSTRDYRERGIIDVRYINTRANPADLFTKPLPPHLLTQHRSRLGLSPAPNNEYLRLRLQDTPSPMGGSVVV